MKNTFFLLLLKSAIICIILKICKTMQNKNYLIFINMMGFMDITKQIFKRTRQKKKHTNGYKSQP